MPGCVGVGVEMPLPALVVVEGGTLEDVEVVVFVTTGGRPQLRSTQYSSPITMLWQLAPT